MSTNYQNDEWYFRWQALESAMQTAKDEILAKKSNLPEETSQEQRQAISFVEQLLVCLQSFSYNHFHYFYDGFFSPQVGKKIDYSAEYPPEHVLSVILDQIGFDLRVLIQAANQRLSTNTQLNLTLQKADELGQKALEPSISHFGLADTIVISYFKKSASIRVIPYAKVALVGIPFTVLREPVDFLAIPHEIGHYVYWQGKVNGASGQADPVSKLPVRQELSNKVAKSTKWCFKWLEETFADVYGCSVAGPAIALSFQDLQMQKTLGDFIKNDEEHPVPILRPNIYNKILNQFQSSWGELLDKRWNGENGSNGERHRRYPNNEFVFDRGGKKQIEEAISDKNGPDNLPVDMMVKKILALFNKGNDKNVIFENSSWWRGYLTDKTTIDSLYQDFKNYIPQTLEPSIREVQQISCNPYEALKERWLLEGATIQDLAENEKPEWLAMLIADGWATKGPICEGSGTCD